MRVTKLGAMAGQVLAALRDRRHGVVRAPVAAGQVGIHGLPVQQPANDAIAVVLPFKARGTRKPD